MKKNLFALIALLVCGVGSALAASSTPDFDRRQANQEQRIEQGIRSGELTPHEVARLERGQAHLQAVESRAKADGVVTPGERARMRHEADQQSRRIYRQKHDRQHDYDHNGYRDRHYR